ncbi:MAG: rod shape-determining protein MreC [Acidimicrobiales bacterium]
MAVANRTGRSRATIVLLIITSIFLLTLDFRDFGPLESAQSSIRSVFSPVQDAADGVFSPVGDAWSSITEYDDLASENERLRLELEALQGQALADESASARLTEALAQLEIEYVADIPKVTAQVVGSVTNFDDFTIVLDKGSDSGIAVGMPAVTDLGLVGRVSEVDGDQARIQLITEPDFQLGIRVVGIDDVALARGTGENQPLLITEGLEAAEEVVVGDLVETSGLERSVYPAGVPVGIVSDVTVDEGTLERIISVLPTADVENLSLVSILLYETE